EGVVDTGDHTEGHAQAGAVEGDRPEDTELIVLAARDQSADLDGEHRAGQEVDAALGSEQPRAGDSRSELPAAVDGRWPDDAGAAEDGPRIDGDGALRLRTEDQECAAVDLGRAVVAVIAAERLRAGAHLGEAAAVDAADEAAEQGRGVVHPGRQ